MVASRFVEGTPDFFFIFGTSMKNDAAQQLMNIHPTIIRSLGSARILVFQARMPRFRFRIALRLGRAGQARRRSPHIVFSLHAVRLLCPYLLLCMGGDHAPFICATR
jgi:hypothetical protein